MKWEKEDIIIEDIDRDLTDLLHCGVDYIIRMEYVPIKRKKIFRKGEKVVYRKVRLYAKPFTQAEQSSVS